MLERLFIVPNTYFEILKRIREKLEKSATLKRELRIVPW